MYPDETVDTRWVKLRGRVCNRRGRENDHHRLGDTCFIEMRVLNIVELVAVGATVRVQYEFVLTI